MIAHVLIAGTGRMALDLAGFLAERGCVVTLRSRTSDSSERTRRARARIGRRLGRGEVSCLGPSDPLPVVDAVFETTVEDLTTKRSVVAELASLLPESVPIASNSSAILPTRIHPRCMGLHFFHPVFLTRTVEWIAPPGIHPDATTALAALLDALELAVITEDEEHAFAANRLLLPVQVRCAREVLSGAAAIVIDEVCQEAGFPQGLLRMLDAIGLDVALAAARAYARGQELAPLVELLERQVTAGRLGDKSHAGLVQGAPLPVEARPIDVASLARELHELFRATCRDFVDRGELARADLELVTRKVFGIDWALP